jgi:hypothetical protein
MELFPESKVTITQNVFFVSFVPFVVKTSCSTTKDTKSTKPFSSVVRPKSPG